MHKHTHLVKLSLPGLPRTRLRSGGKRQKTGSNRIPSLDYLSARFARRFFSPFYSKAEPGPKLLTGEFVHENLCSIQKFDPRQTTCRQVIMKPLFFSFQLTKVLKFSCSCHVLPPQNKIQLPSMFFFCSSKLNCLFGFSSRIVLQS